MSFYDSGIAYDSGLGYDGYNPSPPPTPVTPVGPYRIGYLFSPPVLQPWQMSYQGLTFGYGTPLRIQKVTGLGSLATIAHKDVQRPRDHGEIIGLDVYAGRDITIDLDAYNDGTSLASTLQSLAAVSGVGLTTEQPLWIQLPQMPLLAVMCRPRQRTIDMDFAYAAGLLAVPSLQFHATDPRVYTAASSATVGLSNPTSGLGFPVTFPASFGITSPNTVTVTNDGNTESRPVLVINGPVTNPSIANGSVAGTPSLVFANPAQTSYTVLAGDQLVVDLDYHTALYFSGGMSSGTAGASRRSWLVYGSTWWTLQPGANLVQFLSSDSSAVGGTVEVQWASAYQL